MSQNLRTSLIIDLAGNLQGKAGQFLTSMQKMSTGGSRSMHALKKAADAAGRGLDSLGNRYTALLSGAAGVGAVRMVGDLSMRLTYLSRQGQVSRTEIDKLYTSILNVAQDKDIRVDPSEILSGVETIVEKLGDMKLAEENLRNIGFVIRATGAAGKDAGDMIANFREKFDLKGPDEMLQALDILVVQGKSGSFTLKDMVTQGNRVTAAYGSMGRSGIKAVREMGAFLQVFRKSSGNAEDASTAFKNFFADMMDKKKHDLLARNGISIWDPVKLKQGKKEIRSIVDIIDDIMRKTGGDPEKISEIFGMQSMDGVKAFIKFWNNNGKNAAKDFMNVTADGKELMSDSATMAKEFNAAVQNLHTSWQKFASSNLTKPVQDLANYLNGLQSGTVDRWLKLAVGFGLFGGAAIGMFKLIKGVREIRSWFGTGAAAGGMGGGIPVTVTNLPLGGINPATGRREIPRVSPMGVFGGIGAAATPAVGTAVVGYTSMVIGEALAKAEAKRTSTRELQNILSRQLVMGGGVHSYQAQLIARELQQRGAADVSGTIKLVIDNNDSSLRVSHISSSNKKVRFDVDSGLIMAH